jgi:moderate conductance mechanosensitive channel
MYKIEPLRPTRILGLAALALVAGVAFAAGAKDAPTEKAIALPQPLTRESVRELVARLSDDEVRTLLLDQLDRAAAAEPAKGKPGMGMAGRVEQHAGMMRNVLDDLKDAAVALPGTLRNVGAKLVEPDGLPRLGLLAGLLVAMFGAGWVAEKLYDRGLHAYRMQLRQTAAGSFAANAFRVAIGLSLDLAGIVVFGVVAITTFFLMWHEHDLQRIAILNILIVIVALRLVALFARFLLAPAATADRLLPFADAPARTLYRFVLAFAAVFALEVAMISVLEASGANAAASDVIAIVALAFYLVIVNSTIWRVRAPIAALIRGDRERGAVIGWLADLWPVIATLYFVGVAVGRVFGILAGQPAVSSVGVLSILLVIGLPIVDMALCRALAAAASAAPKHGAAPMRGMVTDYEHVFRRAVHIVITVLGLLIFAHLWDLDVFALAQKSMGGKISSSLLGISIVLLLAFMIWEVAKAAIDRRLRAEGEEDDPEVPKSRLRTLLPIIRGTVLVTIVVMATMSMLAALGVDILPLLAGASVVGVAIGFGSQTLVRDIVSGAFFLMDDAFRLGEYIEVGDAKGRVEKINVRSIFLRHHRGAINILPYGEIKRLRNTSRDWMIMVMDFRLTYDTNLATVKKIFKEIGADLSADPELAPDLLQTLKLAGVQSTEDSAIVVRAKFTARPEGEPYMIRKAAYTKILKAFREAGIKFAHRQVTVNVPPSRDDMAVRGAASAAMLEAPSGNPAA